MTDEYVRTENGYFFTDISAPSEPDTSFGNLIPPGNPETTVPDAGTTTLDGETVIQYEDDDVIMDHFTYDGSGNIVSYLETNKSTGYMILYTYTATAAPALESIGSDSDYQNFAVTGSVSKLADDVPNSDIKNYDVTETPIAYIDENDVPIPA